MLEPRYKKKDGPAPMSQEEIHRWQNRHRSDERVAEEIAANLRAAREAREAEMAPQKPGFDEEEG